MKKEISSGLITLLLVALTLLLLTLFSCKTSGYGCHGKESWNHMVRRINHP